MGGLSRTLTSIPGEPSRESLSCELAGRLQARRAEIEEALLSRTTAVSDPSAVPDPEYLRGLRQTVHTAVGQAITVLEDGIDRTTPLPVELSAQARLAVRNEVRLGTVLRRYAAGHALFCDYLLREAGEAPAHAVRQALRAEGLLLDRTLTAVVDAYWQEVERRSRPTERRRLEQVKRLLAGESGDTAELSYDLDGWHLAVLASGHRVADSLRWLATAADRQLLLVRSGGSEVWAWLGGQNRLDAEEVAQHLRGRSISELTVVMGESGRGISGWRLTHRQAKLALSVALRSEDRIVTYSDVALLASVLKDSVLEESLRQAYLAPLEGGRDGGLALRETLRAYLAAGRNVSSAAAALGVSRQTVKRRICIAEERIGHPLSERAAEIETALRLPRKGTVNASNLQHR